MEVGCRPVWAGLMGGGRGRESSRLVVNRTGTNRSHEGRYEVPDVSLAPVDTHTKLYCWKLEGE